MGSTIDQGELIGFSIQSIAFGAYLVLSAATAYALQQQKHTSKGGRRCIRISGVLLFILIVVHWTLDQSRLWTAFIEDQDKSNGAAQFYSTLPDCRHALRNLTYILQVIIFDCLLVWRLYVIWSKPVKIIILPVLWIIGTAACSMRAFVGMIEAPADTSLHRLGLLRWVISAVSLSFATNILAAVLISCRVISISRGAKYFGAPKLSPVMVLMVSSVGLHCAINAFILGTLLTGSAIDSIGQNAASPVNGISFCCVTLHARLRQSLPQSSSELTGQELPLSFGSWPSKPRRTAIGVRVDTVRDCFTSDGECHVTRSFDFEHKWQMRDVAM